MLLPDKKTLDVLSRNIEFLVFLSSFSAVSAGFVPSLFKL